MATTLTLIQGISYILLDGPHLLTKFNFHLPPNKLGLIWFLCLMAYQPLWLFNAKAILLEEQL